MASIIDAFRETVSERYSILKLFTLSVPTYYCYYLSLQAQKDVNFFNWLTILTIVLLIGFLAKVTSNGIGEKNDVLPAPNPFILVYAAFKALLATLPYTLLSYLLANFFSSLINIAPWIDITLKTVIWLVAAAIILTAFLMYATNEKINDAFRVKLLFDKAGDLSVALIFLILKLAVMDAIIVGVIGYTIFILCGLGYVLDYFIIFSVIYNLAVLGHYFAQIHYELFERNLEG